jgi:hypothetical protein
MNIFTDIFFLFIYLTLLFYFKFPDITNNNYIFHKLIIFISVFVFRFVIELIKKIKNKCKVDPLEILKESLLYSLFNIVGYSIYIDLMYMNVCSNYNININSDNQRFLIASLIMTIFTMLISAGKLLFIKSQQC